MIKLHQLTSSYFVTGFETDDRGMVLNCAPIINWLLHKNINNYLKYFKKKEWKLEEVRTMSITSIITNKFSRSNTKDLHGPN